MTSHDGTYVIFRKGWTDSTKTNLWAVYTKDATVQLGVVKWFAPWRKYCFFPAQETVFEQICLREIAQFIEDRTKEHKQK